MLDLAGRESIYQPEQTGLIFPEHVRHKTVEEERLHRNSGWSRLVVPLPSKNSIMVLQVI